MGHRNGEREAMNSLRIGVILEERFQRLPNGRLFSPGGFGNDIWARYVDAFGQVMVIARVQDAEASDPSWTEITLPGVQIAPITAFLGLGGFFRNLPWVVRDLWRVCRGLEGMIVRAPGTLAILAAPVLWRHKQPFAVELVGDPIDVFGSGVGGRLGPGLRTVFVRNVKWLCAHADAVCYVTREALQRRYPARQGTFTIAASSVQLPRDIFAFRSRMRSTSNDPQVFCAASLEVPYKGLDVLLEALAAMPAPPRLRVAGDGRLRSELEARAQRVGLSKYVTFLGRLTKDEVLNEMRHCDLYVQPSLTEGLPRAVIEAMATAAPVVSTNVGGLPELVRAEDMVRPGDAIGLAVLLEKVLMDPARLRAMSRHSLDVARDYEASILDERRNGLYAHLRACAERRQV